MADVDWYAFHKEKCVDGKILLGGHKVDCIWCRQQRYAEQADARRARESQRHPPHCTCLRCY